MIYYTMVKAECISQMTAACELEEELAVVVNAVLERNSCGCRDQNKAGIGQIIPADSGHCAVTSLTRAKLTTDL